jgi:hypothetical protein
MEFLRVPTDYLEGIGTESFKEKDEKTVKSLNPFLDPITKN